MTFVSPFRAPVSAPFPSQAAAATVSWWLSGGVTAAQCVAAYQPKGAASLAASYVNLNNPGIYDAAPGSAPSWISGTGWAGGGTSWLTTGITPATDQSWSVLVRYTGLSASSSLFGSYNANGMFLLQGATPTGMRSGNGSISVIAENAPSVASGVYGFAGRTPYENGVAESSIIGVGAGTSMLAIYILALNLSGSATQNTNATIQAFAIYNITLSAAQVLAITTAMQAL